MIDGFVFDMDGVLYDTERLCNICFLKVGSQYGVDSVVMNDLMFACVGLNAVATKDKFLSVLGEKFPYDKFCEEWRAEVRSIIIEQGLPVKKGAYMLLEYLKTNRYPVALATSSSKNSTMSHLEQSKMKDYFSAIVTGDMVSKCKPDPEPYLTACKLLNINPGRSVAIEDSPNGLKSAKVAGLKTIMVEDQIPYTDDLAPYVDIKFNSLTDVLEVMRKNELFNTL